MLSEYIFFLNRVASCYIIVRPFLRVFCLRVHFKELFFLYLAWPYRYPALLVYYILYTHNGIFKRKEPRTIRRTFQFILDELIKSSI